MIYFVRQGLLGNVKIGYTADIVKRLRGLQTGHASRLLLMRLFDGAAADEKRLHLRFKRLSVGGEWFRFDQALMADVDLVEIDSPEIGRRGTANWPKTEWEYENALWSEVRTIVNIEDIARRFAVAPWEVKTPYGERALEKWFAAIALMAAERGHSEITYALLMESRAALRRFEILKDEQDQKKKAIEREASWMRRHPGVTPWWRIYSENQHIFEPSEGMSLLAADEAVAA